MNKKGFTLIEILGVIVIVGLLLLIVAPNLLNRINPKETEISNLQKEMLEEAAGLYADTHKDTCQSECTVSVFKLKTEGYINEKVLDAKDKTRNIDDVSIIIKNNNGKKTYTITGYEND